MTILFKIMSFGAKNVRVRHSSSLNGFHVKFTIPDEKEGISRLVFDDQRRFSADLVGRDESSRNVLWDRKLYRKGSHTIELRAGQWVKAD